MVLSGTGAGMAGQDTRKRIKARMANRITAVSRPPNHCSFWALKSGAIIRRESMTAKMIRMEMAPT